MSNSKRLSQSSWRERLPLLSSFISVSDDDAQEWLTKWRTVFARGMQVIFMPFYSRCSCGWPDLIDSRMVSVDADTSVEEACDVSPLNYSSPLVVGS